MPIKNQKSTSSSSKKSTSKSTKGSKARAKPKPNGRTPEQKAENHEIIGKLFLQDFSLRQIAEKTGLSHETVRKDIKEIQKNIQKQHAEKIALIVFEDVQRLRQVRNESWQAWELSNGIRHSRSVITTEKCIALKDSDGGQRLSEPFIETKTIERASQSIGNPLYLKEIISSIVETHRLLGTYEKEAETDEPIEAVRFEQNVYIPGLGALTPEVLAMIKNSGSGGGQDLWHLLESLLQNQQPHSWDADNESSPSNQ